jgi:glycosyltransferase involved in cell wall biosynthesis
MNSATAGPARPGADRMPDVMGSDASAQGAPASADGPAVLHVIPTALGRGAQVFARSLVDRLGGPDGGHRLVSLFEGADGVPVDVSFGLPASASTGFHPRSVAALARHLRGMEYDVVVAHGGDAFKYVAMVARRPIVYCAIGTWPHGERRLAQRTIWRWLLRRAAFVVAVSDDVAADCRTVHGIDDRVTVIPNGRDESRYAPSDGPAPPSTTTGSAVLLFVGALTPGKRPERFVDVVRALRSRGADVTGAIVGDGPLRAVLAEQVEGTGVELLGWCADVVPHLQRADLLVFPSSPDGEGMPGVLIEAGLCGLPVVATRVAGASTVIEDERTGRLVPVDDFDGLLDACDELVRDPTRRRTMGCAARERCTRQFTLGVVARRWQDLLDQVAGAGVAARNG